MSVVALMMLFLVAIHGSNAQVNLCKGTLTTYKYPLLASSNQNLSPQDPLYSSSCWTYNTADWFSFACFFGVPQYDCAPITTTPTTTPSTTTTASNCAPTTTATVSTTPIGSNAKVNFCKGNITTYKYPLLASSNQNLSTQDPLYSLSCWTYNTAALFSFACFFGVPQYDCAPVTTTLQPITTTTTCAPVDPCIARYTGVHVAGIGNLIVGTYPLGFNDSASYCQSITGCNLWTPQDTSDVIFPLINNITVACTADQGAGYAIGVFISNAPTLIDINTGNVWHFCVHRDICNPSTTFPGIFITDTGVYSSEPAKRPNIPICYCGQ